VSDLLVLCYHAISEEWPSDLSVTPAQLEAQLRHLLGHGYQGATFTAALEGNRPRRTVVVTFDDGYRSVLELGFPVLRAAGLPGTVFVPTALVGSGMPMSWPGIDHWADGPYANELLPLAWEELGTLADAGWEIGSHSRSHAHLTALDDAELDLELSGSRSDCERRTGRPCTSISYPFGDIDARVVAAARQAGYRAAATLSNRRHRPRPLEWPRIGFSREDSLARFRRQTSPLVRTLRTSPAGPAADRAYGTLVRALRRRRGTVRPGAS
jgi:peptidoglycan/xylan/chitin deacetylase (PgdA/CDA1 family)